MSPDAADAFVPVVCLGDAGGFPAQFCAVLARVLGEERARFVLPGSLQDPVGAVRPAFQADFRQQTYPLRTWPGQEMWCVWLLSDTAPRTVAECRQARAALEQSVKQGFTHIVFARTCTSPVSGIRDLAGDKAFAFVFALPEGGLLARPGELLAEGAAVYLAGAWLAFCGKRTGNIREALVLPGNGSLFSLGIGVDVPDTGYHTGVVASGLAKDLREAWLAPASAPAVNVPYQESAEALGACLPKEFYSLRENGPTPNDDPTAVRLTLDPPLEFLTVRYKEGQRTPGFLASTVREGWGRRIALLRKLDDYMRLFVLRTADLYIMGGAIDFAVGFQRKFSEVFVLAPAPNGLLGQLRNCLKMSQDYLYRLGSVQIERPEDVSDLDENVGNVVTRARAIPSLPGAIPRVGLILAGLAWATAGVLLLPWSGASSADLNPGLCLFCFCAVAVVLPALVFALWWLPSRGAEKAEEHARNDIFCLHLFHTGRRLKERMRAKCLLLEAELRKMGRSLDDLEKEIRDRMEECPSCAEAGGNRNRKFGPDASTWLVLARKPELLGKIHDRCRRAIAKAGWPRFDAGTWMAASNEQTVAAVREFLDAVPYDRWVEAAHLEADARREIVDDVIQDARVNAFTGQTDPNARTVLVASSGWRASLGLNDNTEVWSNLVPVRSMMALAPIEIGCSLPEGDQAP